MSAGGFIAQALLGGTQQAAQGIGNKIREDAKLKRQQALDETRMKNDKKTATHTSELAEQRQQGQNEYSSEQARLRREHELALADKRYDQKKGLVDYNLKSELTLAREQAEQNGKLTDWQTANLDRINSDIDNLQKMERDLMTGKTDAMQISLAGLDPDAQPEDAAGKLAVIRQRLKAKELSFNRVLGNQKGMDAGAAVLTQAANITDPADRKEFLADLKGSKVYSEDLAKDINEVWGSESQPTQPTEVAPPQSQRQQPQDNNQPEGGMITEAGGSASPQAEPKPEPRQYPQPTAEERPGANPRPPKDSNANRPLMEKQLGPMIEQGARDLKQWSKNKAAEQRAFSKQQLENIAVKDGASLTPVSKAQILQAHGRAIQDLSPEVIEQLKAIFGADAIAKYLN